MPNPPRAGTEEASQFFRKFANTVSGARRSSGEDPSRKQGGSSTPGKGDALLTQVQQGQQPAQPASSSDRLREKILKSGNHMTASYEQRLADIRMQTKNMSPVDASKHPSLLPRQLSNVAGKKCLVLDVDETLVHSSYQPVHDYDLHLPLRVNGSICNVYVAYRPGLKSFLQAVAPMFEIVIFTASVSVYCDPLMNHLDPKNILGPGRLFREHCSVVNGSYVKDLSLLGRQLDQICIIDNSPVAYLFQPRNAIPILSWFDDPSDTELLKLLPMLEEMATSDNVYEQLDPYNARLQEAAAQAEQEQKPLSPNSGSRGSSRPPVRR
jgi:Dullard-like phosphatase family protein